MNKPKLIYSSAVASSLAIVFVAAITIVAELQVPLKDWLKSLSGHHWVSKGILSFLLYVVAVFVMYAVTKNVDHKKNKGALWVAIITTILGSLALLTFFTGYHLELFGYLGMI